MTGKIYLLQNDGTLQPLTEQPYLSEDTLQTLLADHPDLLAGDQIDEAVPRRWLLVARELRVPDQEDGTGRLSLDHLFLDQDAIPTLVEVKRSTDTRVRREVVAQMLDYAANAVVHWPLETIRAQFEATCQAQDCDPDQRILDLIEAGPDDAPAIDAFWSQLKTNLRAGRIRLIFVADHIPPELRRIVEFLNAQMNPAQVLAVEISQYVGKGLKTLVPRVIGQTAEAQQAKGSAQRRTKQWDEPTFFQELVSRHSAVEGQIARRMLEWAQSRNLQVWWGKGVRSGSFVPWFRYNDVDYQLFPVWTYGTVEIYFQWYQYKPPFDLESKRRELLDKLNAIPGVSLPPDAITKRPGIPLSTFQSDDALARFFEIYDWFIEEVQAC